MQCDRGIVTTEPTPERIVPTDIFKIKDCKTNTATKNQGSHGHSFAITWDEYMTICPQPPNASRLSREWTQLMYCRFHELYPSCSIVFTRNRVKKLKSRKKKSHFWVGQAKCKDNNCVTVNFHIKDVPARQKDVVVHITISGTFQHKYGQEVSSEFSKHSTAEISPCNVNPQLLFKRPLTGSDRHTVAQQLLLSKQEPTSAFYESLSNMTDTELRAGNMTACQSPQVLRQAKYELRMKERLAKDMFEELLIQNEDWQAAFPDKEVDGYVQTVGYKPFFVTFYLKEQVQHYIESASNRNHPFIVHFDATGSVMKKMPKNKQPYYYCMIGHDSDIPFLEFLSTAHTSMWLGTLISSFLNHTKICAPNRQFRPRVVVTDFSYALIYSAILAFNETTILPYLVYTFRLLSDKKSAVLGKTFTAAVICEAHMLKAMSVRLNRCERNARKRIAGMIIFARMQRCSSLPVRDNVME